MKLTQIIEEKYETVKEKSITELKRNTLILDKLCELFIDLKERFKTDPLESKRSIENHIRKASFSYEPWDITNFCFALPAFEKWKNFESYTGYFLSSLINVHQEKTENEQEYLLVTKHLQKKIAYLGYENKSKLIIDGSVDSYFGKCNEGYVLINGDANLYCGIYMNDGEIRLKNADLYLGYFMNSGNIICEGNASSYVGYDMSNGGIIIKGNCGDDLGYDMRNGAIHIQGNAGKGIGAGMEGGFIHIEGEYESLKENIRGGIVFHKGKQIVPKKYLRESQEASEKKLQKMRENDEKNKINSEYLKYFSSRDR